MSVDPVSTPARIVEEAAARWLARFDNEEMLVGCNDLDGLAREDDAFAAWLNEDTGHRVAFLRLLSAWERTERLAVISGGAPPTRSFIRRPLVQILAAAACAVMVLAVFGTSSLRHSGSDVAPPLSFQTAHGEIRTVALDDGSELTLNTDTRLKVIFSQAERRVELFQGEAFFDVASAPDRPFRIDAGEGWIEVRGTSFGVERRKGLVEVAVSEGTVWMNSAGQDDRPVSVLTPGMIGYASPTGLLVETSRLDVISDRLLWRTGRLRFDNTPLSEVAAEFNRYNSTQLLIADDMTGAIEIGGIFPLDNVEAFARLAEEGLGMKARREAGRIVLSGK